jgi:sporulation protein YlmC with PRC-barrel domain
MRRNSLILFAVIMVFTMAFSPLALAQQATPTVTPVSADAAEATPTAEMGVDETGADADVADSSGMTDKLPEASGTVRQTFDLLGADVINSAGDDIGELDNLLVVPSTGYIPFALIAAGGLFGLGEKLVPVPFSALQYDPERAVFILDVDEEVLEDAPSLSRYAAPNTRELLRNAELREFWSRLDMDATGALPGVDATDAATEPTVTGTMTDTLPSATPTVTSDDTMTDTLPSATVTITATDTLTATGTLTDTDDVDIDVDATGTVTDTADVDVDFAVDDDDVTAGGLVQVGSFGDHSLRSVGLSGQGEEDLVRITELGGFSIVMGDLGAMDDELDSNDDVADDDAIELTVTPEATEAMTDTVDIEMAVTPMATATIDDTQMFTETAPTEIAPTAPLTTTDTFTDTDGIDADVDVELDDEPVEVDLDEASLEIGRVDDLLIDVEAARVLYVLATLDTARFAAFDTADDLDDTDIITDTDVITGTDVMTDTDTVTGTLPSLTPTPMATAMPDDSNVITGTATVTATVPMTDTDAIDIAPVITDTNTMTDTAELIEDSVRILLIPWHALELDLVDQEFRLLVPPSQFTAAPDAPDYLLPDFTEDGWDNELVEFWGSALMGIDRTLDTELDVTTTPEATAPGTTGSATPAPRRPGHNIATQSGVVMQASEILGTNVNDPLGANLGELTNLLIGSTDGKVYYGVLSYGGFLGLGGRRVAVPWTAFRFNAETETFILDTNQETLDNAPALTQGEAVFGTPGWDAEIQDYWGGQGIETPETDGVEMNVTPDATTGSDINGTGVITDTDVMTGTTGIDTGDASTGVAQAAGQLLRADRLVGLNVTGVDDAGLGEVSDLLVNLDAGQVLYAVVSYGGFLGIGANSVPVPWSSLRVETLDGGAPALRLNIDAATLDNAPQLDLGSLPEDISAGWDTDVRGYWDRLGDQ